MKKRHKQKLVILSIVLFVLFNAPVLLMFNNTQEFIGLPMLLVYIFLVWLMSSVLSYLVFKKFNE